MLIVKTDSYLTPIYSGFHIMGASGAESKTTLCFLEFARWRHRGRSLLSTIGLLEIAGVYKMQ